MSHLTALQTAAYAQLRELGRTSILSPALMAIYYGVDVENAWEAFEDDNVLVNTLCDHADLPREERELAFHMGETMARAERR
jgi:hypothetical protein